MIALGLRCFALRTTKADRVADNMAAAYDEHSSRFCCASSRWCCGYHACDSAFEDCLGLSRHPGGVDRQARNMAFRRRMQVVSTRSGQYWTTFSIAI